MKVFKRKLSPISMLPLGFLGIIVIGTLLFMLPIATVDGKGLAFVDAIFTSTSGVCVTGLTVINIGAELSFFGQLILLLLIQCGGLGFMMIASLLFMMVGKRFSLHDRMNMAESMSHDKLQGVVKMSIYALVLTLIIELVGVALLAIRFIPEFGFGRGIWYSLFHSISAFCNAGFDAFGTDTSFIPYVNDALVSLTLMFLIIMGGLGFAVIVNIINVRDRRRTKAKHFRIHTKVVLLMTAILILVGAILIYAFEFNNSNTLGGLSATQKIIPSFFQSVTSRTAGFESIDQSLLSGESKLLICMLMFIGASPAGTGGGIKTTTLAVLLTFVWTIMRNKSDIELFERRLSVGVVRRAMSILLLAIAVLIVSVFAISLIERGQSLSMGDIVFEVVSAMSTTGLSTGITPELSTASKLMLTLVMYMGRVGLLTVALNIGGFKKDNNKKSLQFPLEDIPVG